MIEELKSSSKDFLAQLEAEERERSEKPFLIRIFLDFIDFVWYRVILRIKDWPSEIKWKFQSITRGYGDPDIWNLNSFILKTTYTPLKVFIKNYQEHGMSLPMEFASDPAAWLSILKKIEFAFDSFWDDEFECENRFTRKMTVEQKVEHYKQVEEGLTLFGKYIRDLWD